MSAGEPQPVPHGVVESLIEATDADGNIHYEIHLKEGQAVKVTAGPFVDLIGQLERLDDNGRVRVLLEIMGAKARVALPNLWWLLPEFTTPSLRAAPQFGSRSHDAAQQLGSFCKTSAARVQPGLRTHTMP